MKIRCIETTDPSDAPVVLEAFQKVFPSTRGPTLADLHFPIVAAAALVDDETELAHGSVLAEYGPGGKLVRVHLVSATSRRTLWVKPSGCTEMMLNSEHAAQELLTALGDVRVVVWAKWNNDADMLGRSGKASSFVTPPPEEKP